MSFHYQILLGLLAVTLVNCGDGSSRETNSSSSVTKPLSTTTQEIPPEKKPLKPISDCKALSKIFANPKAHEIPPADILKKYSNFELLPGSHSGAGVFSVLTTDSQEKAVFKTLPGDISMDSKNFREAILSCRLPQLSANNYLSGDKKAGMFFPKLYDVGFTTSMDPSASKIITENDPVPFMVIEYIDGLALLDFVEDINGVTVKKFGYNLDNAPKDFLKGSLLQITIALLNADKEIKFRHNDLHPLNVIISTEVASFSTTIKGKNVSYRGPLVKIIDFGHGQDKDNPGGLISLWAHKPLKSREERLIDHELAQFPEPSTFKTNLILNLVPLLDERDIRNINILIQAFGSRLKAQGVKNIDYCMTYQECLELIASW